MLSASLNQLLLSYSNDVNGFYKCPEIGEQYKLLHDIVSLKENCLKPNFQAATSVIYMVENKTRSDLHNGPLYGCFRVLERFFCTGMKLAPQPE